MTEMLARNHFVTSIEALERLYGQPYGPSIAKETDRITAHYRAFIEAAPFFALASSGPDGLDCSPRGDAPGFVRVLDEKTLLVPDRRGNNRIDTLRNILQDPRVALLFLIPGCGETIRVNGHAQISTDPALLDSFLVAEAEIALLRRELFDALNQTGLRVLIDCKQLARMSTAAAEMFGDLAHHLHTNKCTMAMCRLKPELQLILQMLPMFEHISFFRDKPIALTSSW